MPPYLFPNQPDPNNDPNKKLGAGDLFNLGEIKEKLASTIAEAVQQAVKQNVKDTSSAISSIRKAEESYINYTTTGQRQKYKELLANQERVKNSLRLQQRFEESKIRSTYTSAKDQEKALQTLRLGFTQKFSAVEKAKAGEIANARRAAWASENPAAAAGIGMIPGGKTFLAGGVGGLAAAGASAGVGAVAIVLGKIIETIINLGAESARTSASLRNAGIEVGQNSIPLVTKSLQGLSGTVGTSLLPRGEDLLKFMGKFTDSNVAVKSVMADQGKGFGEFAAMMGVYGISLDQSAEMFTDLSNKYGASLKDTTSTFMLARTVSKATNITFKEAFQSMVKLKDSMQLVTTNGNVVNDMYKTFVVGLQGLSPQMVSRITESFGNLVGNMKPSQMAGIMAYTSGKMPDFEEVVKASQKGAPQAILEFGKKVLSQVPEKQRGFAVQSLAEQGMLPQEASTVLGAKAFLDFLKNKNNLSTEDATKAWKDFQKASETDAQRAETERKKLQAEGLATLRDIQGPLKGLENLFKDFMSNFGVFVPAFQRFNERFQAFSSADILGKIKEGAKTSVNIGATLATGGLSGIIAEGIKTGIDHYTSGTDASRATGVRKQGK